VEDNYKIRQMLNKIIYEIRRVQDFMIKTNTKSKVANAITKKLKGSKKTEDDCCKATSRLKDDDCEATSQPKSDDDGEVNDI
jgi:hypothetical protein